MQCKTTTFDSLELHVSVDNSPTKSLKNQRVWPWLQTWDTTKESKGMACREIQSKGC